MCGFYVYEEEHVLCIDGVMTPINIIGLRIQMNVYSISREPGNIGCQPLMSY